MTNFMTISCYNTITIHTHVTNSMYFLIIQVYKVILYLFILYIHIFTHITIHTNNIIKKKIQIAYTINIKHILTHI